MFGGKSSVLVCNPAASLLMQLAPARMQQRGIGTVTDQGVAENQLVAFRTQQELVDQQSRVIGGVTHPMADRGQRCALAQHRCGLQRILVGCRKPVHAGLDQRLYRSGQAGRTFVAGIEQQLLEKQRITFCALDATAQQGIGNGRGPGRQSHGLVRIQRTQIHARHRQTVQYAAPIPEARVTGEAGREHHQQGLTRRQRQPGAELAQCPGVGPVDVFHQQQRRRTQDLLAHQLPQRIHRQAASGLVIKCRQQGPRFRAGRYDEGFEQIGRQIGAIRASQRGTLQRVAPGRFVGIRRQAQQALHQRAHRVMPGVCAKVEDSGGMADQTAFTRHIEKLRHQARFAQARITAHEHNASALARQATMHQGLELLHFLRASDQRARAALGHRPFTQDAVRHHRPFLALDLDRPTGLAFEMLGHLLPGLRADDHLTRLGQAAQPRRGVDGVAGQREVTRARVAAPRDHQAGMQAGVHGQHPTESLRHTGRNAVDDVVQFERRTDGPACVVATRHRYAEHRHHFVADELVHPSPVAFNDGNGLTLDA